MPAVRPPVTPERMAARSRLNALQRHRDPGDPAIADARRELATVGLEAHIRHVIGSAPPLTAEQLERLRGLLPAPTQDVAS